MKRRPRIIKELETSEVALERLLADRARIDAQIAALRQRREADVLQLVLETTKRLNLAQLPAASILAGLEQLVQGARVDRLVFDPAGNSADADTSNDPRQELVDAFVRLTRNTSGSNREILAREGVRWNGRSGGWSGRITLDALQRLRDVFPGRVDGPSCTESSAALSQDEADGSAVEAAVPPIESLDAPLVNMEDEASRVAPPEELDEAEVAVPAKQPAVPAATRLMTSPFRVLPPRRPSPT
jgi:hypothetical protein